MVMRIYDPAPAIDEYSIGDLVIFTGYLYTPDYIHMDRYDNVRTIGIVLGINLSHYKNVLYRVYWLKTGRIAEVVGTHLKLVYMLK